MFNFQFLRSNFWISKVTFPYPNYSITNSNHSGYKLWHVLSRNRNPNTFKAFQHIWSIWWLNFQASSCQTFPTELKRTSAGVLKLLESIMHMYSKFILCFQGHFSSLISSVWLLEVSLSSSWRYPLVSSWSKEDMASGISVHSWKVNTILLMTKLCITCRKLIFC